MSHDPIHESPATTTTSDDVSPASDGATTTTSDDVSPASAGAAFTLERLVGEDL